MTLTLDLLKKEDEAEIKASDGFLLWLRWAAEKHSFDDMGRPLKDIYIMELDTNKKLKTQFKENYGTKTA